MTLSSTLPGQRGGQVSLPARGHFVQRGCPAASIQHASGGLRGSTWAPCCRPARWPASSGRCYRPGCCCGEGDGVSATRHGVPLTPNPSLRLQRWEHRAGGCAEAAAPPWSPV